MERKATAGMTCVVAALTASACHPTAKVVVPAEARETREPQEENAEAAWVVHDFAACGVRVEFPGRTARSTTAVQTPRGAHTVETQTAELPGIDGTMVATCADMPVSKENVETLLDVTRDSMLASIGARLVEERRNLGGRELRFTMRGHEVRVRLVVLGGGIFSLVVAPVDAFPAEAVSRFLGSATELPRPQSLCLGPPIWPPA